MFNPLFFNTQKYGMLHTVPFLWRLASAILAFCYLYLISCIFFITWLPFKHLVLFHFSFYYLVTFYHFQFSKFRYFYWVCNNKYSLSFDGSNLVFNLGSNLVSSVFMIIFIFCMALPFTLFYTPLFFIWLCVIKFLNLFLIGLHSLNFFYSLLVETFHWFLSNPWLSWSIFQSATTKQCMNSISLF